MRKYHVLKLAPLNGPQEVLWSGDDLAAAGTAYHLCKSDPRNEGSFILLVSKVSGELVVTQRTKPGKST